MKNKRILSLVLAFAMLLGTFSFAFADEANIPEEIQWLIDEGYVLGDDGGYRLGDNITRAEVAVIVAKALGLEDAAKAAQPVKGQFKDVPAGRWDNGFINVLAGKGILNGYPDGTFKADKEITNSEVITIMVQMLGGLTKEEKETGAKWPFNMIAKATELGLFENVNMTDYSASAVRENTFMMLYNALMNEKLGGFDIVKAMVLENYRVEAIGKDEVMIETLKDGKVQKITLPEKVGDVENLLGKVVNISFDRTGKAAKVVVDDSYKYEIGAIQAITKDSLKINGTTYTVSVDERYHEQDSKNIRRSYFNNKPMTYRDFYQDKAAGAAEYARVTISNGKVLFIDAFAFDDIAPVKEVKNDGSEVYVYNDARDGAVKKFELNARTKVTAIKDGQVTVATKEDIAANDVIHAYANGYIVRKDAVVSGEFAKVSEDRYGDFYVHIDDDEYYIPVDANKKPVYSYDSKDFYTLEAKFADSLLKEFRKQKVTALLDLNDSVQYIGSDIALGEYVALVTRVSGNDLRVIKTDNTKVDLRVNLDTEYKDATGHRNLNKLNVGNLVYISETDGLVDKMVDLTADAKEVKALDTRNIKVDSDEYRILGATNIFVEPSLEARTAKDVADAYKKDSSDVKAYVISGETFSKVSRRAHAYTESKHEAHTIVFTKIKIASDLKTRIAEFDGFADRQEREMRIILADGTKETRMVYDKNMPTLKGGDIIEIKETKDDKKDIEAVKVLIEAAGKNVLEVKDYDRSGNLKLVDKAGNEETYYVTSDTQVFGRYGLASAKRVSIALEKEDSKYVAAVLIRKDDADVTGMLPGKTAPDEEVTGVVTYINTDEGYEAFAVDKKTPYFLNDKTVLTDKDNNVLAMGAQAVIEKLVKGDQVEVTIKGDVMTIKRLATKDELAAAPVEEQINALPAAEEITAENVAEKKAEVEAARAAYNALTDEQKALVTNLQKLKDAEAKVLELTGPAKVLVKDIEGYQIVGLLGKNTISLPLEGMQAKFEDVTKESIVKVKLEDGTVIQLSFNEEANGFQSEQRDETEEILKVAEIVVSN